MTGRNRVQLIVGAEFHDADYVRRELLEMLSADPLNLVRCDSDWSHADALGETDFLLTYSSNVFPDAAGRTALEAFLRRGGRWLAIHGSAAYTEFRPPAVDIGGIRLPGLTDTPDKEGAYMDILGCRFVSHLAMQEIEIAPCSDHPLVAGIAPFRVTDEPYVMELRGEVEVLASARFTGEAPGYVRGPWLEDEERPQIILHRLGDGEALYVAPGHACGPYDLRPFIDEIPAIRGPWTVPEYREIIARAIRWGTGQSVISTSSPETATG
ncbi:ThuA domain-containing protein [Croceicoccus mobilis]|uniref:ThuA-like domain-containing protein n=1 Tax=Croceicoccus mobilis TaxID=1703339 RepID=A0A916Z8T4_9SPHN|nr:ThuA domain-containing protein [Croceicoccus mobilis]GGD80353.1 hypothetical protein GCM10010990_32810 [Croceicoccus mobilis]